MTRKVRHILGVVMGFAILGAVSWLAFRLVRAIWHQFVTLDANLVVALLTAATTVLVSTLTIVLGRYYERKKEIEAHYRERKTEIYDSFLKEYFKILNNPNDESGDEVPFFGEWQRQMVLWGGADVLVAFMKWRTQLAKADARSMFVTDEFFRALRSDVGLSNRGLEKGAFIRLFLRNPDFFFAMSRQNPDVLLSELAKKEKELGVQ